MARGHSDSDPARHEKAELDQEPDAADQGDESDQDEPRRAIAIVTALAVDADRDPQRQGIEGPTRTQNKAGGPVTGSNDERKTATSKLAKIPTTMD